MSAEDPIETLIGRSGRYQAWLYFLIIMGRFPTEFQLNNVVFIIPNVQYTCNDENAFNITNHCPCENPVYDQSVIATSVTSEWNLICGRASLASLAQSIMQIGILAGSLIFGYISDRYGRKKAAILSMILEVLFITISALVMEFWMFILFRFLIGASVGGVMLCFFVLIIELSGKSFRPYATGINEISFLIGYFLLPIIAYFVREWRSLQLVISVPWVVTIAFYWLIPESPRWLITVGKKKEAIEILTYIAKKNNRPTDSIEAVVNNILEESITNKERHGTYLDLFKTPIIRTYTIIVAFVWMFCAHTFFGMNQYIGRLEGNLYINVLIAAASVTPGLILVVFATLYFRRKVTVVTSFSVAAVSLLVFIFVPYEMTGAYLAFAIIGLIGAYTAFVQIYLYSSELFPTVVRNSAMGFASVFARFGGFVAPFVVNINTEWASILIFSGLALCAAILCLILPETKDVVLLNTIDETERKRQIKSTEDPIETLIGRFGRYQAWIVFIIVLGRFPTEFQLNNVVFIIPNVQYTCYDNDAFNITNHCPCDNPVYDQTNVVSSVTSEWNLICNKGALASLAQSMLQVGIFVGSLVFGHISDRYGRKTTALLSMSLEVVFIVLSAIATELWMFMICRLLIGATVGGVMLCFYVLIIELSGKSFRPYASGLNEMTFGIAYFLLPMIAYFVREWRKLQLMTSAPWVVSLVLYWLVPESPRWLITVGKKKEAIEILTHIAKKNNRPTDNIEEIVNQMHEESINNKEKHATYLDLFRTPKIRLNTILMAFIWMFCAHTYFGVHQYIGRLEGNLYVNIMIAAACHIPGLILVVLATLHFRRKVTVVTSFSVAAVSLLVFIFIPYEMTGAYLAFAIMGLIGAYTAFVQIYLYSSEVFPTVVRNSALGFASMFARIGGFVAPFVVNVGVEWISILIFSGLAFFAALLCLLLPETKGIVLLNTIDETELENIIKSKPAARKY